MEDQQEYVQVLLEVAKSAVWDLLTREGMLMQDGSEFISGKQHLAEFNRRFDRAKAQVQSGKGEV